MPDKTLDSQTLLGIEQALDNHAPHLAPIIRRVLDAPPARLPEQRIGAPPYARYTVEVSEEDAKAVLDALRQIERQHGYKATFADRQINLLSLMWRQCTGLT